MQYTLSDLEELKALAFYEIDSKMYLNNKFDENGEPADWFDLNEISTDEILRKYKIDSTKISWESIKQLEKIFG